MGFREIDPVPFVLQKYIQTSTIFSLPEGLLNPRLEPIQLPLFYKWGKWGAGRGSDSFKAVKANRAERRQRSCSPGAATVFLWALCCGTQRRQGWAGEPSWKWGATWTPHLIPPGVRAWEALRERLVLVPTLGEAGSGPRPGKYWWDSIWRSGLWEVIGLHEVIRVGPLWSDYYGIGLPSGSEAKTLPALQETQAWSHRSGRPPGGGNGNPLQYSCLENPTHGRAWWATVHAVTESDMTEVT